MFSYQRAEVGSRSETVVKLVGEVEEWGKLQAVLQYLRNTQSGQDKGTGVDKVRCAFSATVLV